MLLNSKGTTIGKLQPSAVAAVILFCCDDYGGSIDVEPA